MSQGYWEDSAEHKTTLKTRNAEKTMNACLYNSPIGILKICEADGKITNLSLYQKISSAAYSPDVKRYQCELQDKQEQQGKSCQECHSNESCSELLQKACQQLDEYFQGKRRQFDLPLGCVGTPFQESVWRELQNIPYGETRSYEDIAVKIGNPKAVRAVGQANNKNPILLMIPCHRVIHKNGDISGFACGIETKKYLLELERWGGCL